jgi:16S rRNA processing protein RimM
LVPPRTAERDRPKGGGGGDENVTPPPPSVAGATATSPFGGGLKRIALAAIAGAHGVKGEVRLKLFSESAESLSQYGKLYIGGIERRLLALRDGKVSVARFEGISDRSAAEALRGALVELDRSALPRLGEGEYYHADLVGLPCVDAHGSSLGSVAAVENYGAGDLLEIEMRDGKHSLIPFRPGIADLVGGRIVLDPEFLA